MCGRRGGWRRDGCGRSACGNRLRCTGHAALGLAAQRFDQVGNQLHQFARGNGHVGVKATIVGLGAFEHGVQKRHLFDLQAFGQNLAQFQNTRFTLAQCATDIAAAEAFLNASVAAYQQGQLTPEAVSALKLHTTELFSRVADACLQLFGGYGYMAEYPISRFWTDARVLRIYGGTSEIMKELVARSLLGR